ncbi:MAG: hypothetical protein ACTHU0_34580 [Kofleriaceae bacterium]
MIALQTSGDSSPKVQRRAKALIQEHADAWSDGLISRLSLDVRFLGGFVDTFVVPSNVPALRARAYDAFLALFQHPLFRFARHAEVGLFGVPDETGDQNGVYASYDLSDFFQPMEEAFDEHPAPFRSIAVGFPQRARWRPKCAAGKSPRFQFATAAVTLPPVEVLARIERLSLRCRVDNAYALAKLAPQLVELELLPSEPSEVLDALRDVTSQHWPRLEALSVGRACFDNWGDQRTWQIDACPLRSLLEQTSAPQLRRLTLHGCDSMDQVSAALDGQCSFARSGRACTFSWG